VERDIGAKVSRSLKPAAQCAKGTRTAANTIGQIGRTFILVTGMYIFAAPAWSPWPLGDKDCLERVQTRAVRMMSGQLTKLD
jgi:hypothetical protein